MQSLGATRSVSGCTSFLTLYRSGTGKCVLLQTTDPSLTHMDFDYIPEYVEIEYAQWFSNKVDQDNRSEDTRTCVDFFSAKEKVLHNLLLTDHKCIHLTKDQLGKEWMPVKRYFVSSTGAYHILPRERPETMNDAQFEFLSECLGVSVQEEPEEQKEEEVDWTMASDVQLKALRVKGLQEVCKTYNRPYSNKRVTELISEIRKGPKESPKLSVFEKYLKRCHLAPLSDRDKTPHKIGSLNEKNVRSVMAGIVHQLGYALVEMYEVGMVLKSEAEWAGTNVDGLIHMCKRPSTVESTIEVNNDEHPVQNNPVVTCAVEMKTPYSKDIKEKVARNVNSFGPSITINITNPAFKQLVYKPEYRVQVVHHA